MTAIGDIRFMAFLHEDGEAYVLVRYTLDDNTFNVLDHSGEVMLTAPADTWQDTARNVMEQQWRHTHPTTAMVGEWMFDISRSDAAKIIVERTGQRSASRRADDDYAMVFEAQTKWRIKRHEMGETNDILLIKMPMVFTEDVMEAMLDIAGRAADNQLTDDDKERIEDISFQMRTSFMVSACRGAYDTFWMDGDDIIPL